MTFQRARSEEQREIRRQRILDTTAAMLDTMTVSDVSLNELSRRVGLAKSNVLRYFESREAILLELLDRATKRWLDMLSERLAEIDPKDSATTRGERLAAILAATLTQHPTLCDLLSTQASVLEYNVSVEVVARYKRAMVDNHAALTASVRHHLPELGDEGAWRVCAMTLVVIGALWSYTHHSASVQAAYAADPTVATLRMDFTVALEETLATLIAGTLTRADQTRDD